MKGLHFKTVLLFIGYGMLLHLLASFLLVQNTVLLFVMRGQWPVLFIARFGIFWLISFLLAMLLFLLYLRFKRMSLTPTQRHHIKRLSRTAFVAGIISILLAMLFTVINY